MAQSVEHPTLDFGSGHDLVVSEFKALIGLCAGSAEPAWDILSLPLSLSLPLLCALFLSLKINKINLKKKKKNESGPRILHHTQK